jgi:four helix bundle protein
MRDAARSAKQNIREGYRKDTVGEFARGIKISIGSLQELEGDIDDCLEDALIDKEEHDKLKDMFGKTNYQIDRYLDSLYKLDKEGKWKSRFKSNRY